MTTRRFQAASPAGALVQGHGVWWDHDPVGSLADLPRGHAAQLPGGVGLWVGGAAVTAGVILGGRYLWSRWILPRWGSQDVMLSSGAQADPSKVPATGVAGVQLGEFFDLTEMVGSATAAARGIDNTPTPEAIVALRALVTHVLDPLRRWLGVPVLISSGYRSPALNAAIGGAADSQHMRGEGVDIKVGGLTSPQLAAKILKARELGILPGWDQLIHYKSGYRGHVHVSWKATGAQRGLVTYAPREGVYEHGVAPAAAA